jgi:hypothetical protein
MRRLAAAPDARHVVSAVCFLNTLWGDVHAHVTRVRHAGDEKN